MQDYGQLLVITAKSNSIVCSKEIVFSFFTDTKLFVIFEQVKNVVHKVIFMWILFIMQSVLKGLFEDGYYIDPVGRRDKLQRAFNFFNKLVSACSSLLIHVNFVSDHYARDVRALVAHFLIPVPEIYISHFSIHVKHQYACMSTKIISWVKFIE